MTAPTLDAATIDHHVRHAHTIRSRAVTRALGLLPAILRRTARAIAAVFA